MLFVYVCVCECEYGSWNWKVGHEKGKKDLKKGGREEEGI